MFALGLCQSFKFILDSSVFVMVCCFTVYGIYKIKKSKAKKNKKE